MGGGEREEPLSPLGEQLVPPQPEAGLGQGQRLGSVEEVSEGDGE